MTPLVDVYHTGQDRPYPPFLILRSGAAVLQPSPPKGSRWTFWKKVPLNVIAVDVMRAKRLLETQGYYIQ
jgi:hypothetical protein